MHLLFISRPLAWLEGSLKGEAAGSGHPIPAAGAGPSRPFCLPVAGSVWAPALEPAGLFEGGAGGTRSKRRQGLGRTRPRRQRDRALGERSAWPAGRAGGGCGSRQGGAVSADAPGGGALARRKWRRGACAGGGHAGPGQAMADRVLFRRGTGEVGARRGRGRGEAGGAGAGLWSGGKAVCRLRRATTRTRGTTRPSSRRTTRRWPPSR